MDNEMVRRRTSELADRLSDVEESKELRAICSELTPLMAAYWGVHPHSAMEMLEAVTHQLPLPQAHALVRRVVTSWRERPDYDPTAGGNADHCYLSALILSENFDLAESPWVDRVLPGTLKKELGPYRNFDRMRDGDRKKEIVQAIADSTS